MLPTLAAPAPGAKRSTAAAAVAAMQRTETDVAHLAAPEGTRQSLEVDWERARGQSRPRSAQELGADRLGLAWRLAQDFDNPHRNDRRRQWVKRATTALRTRR